MAQLQSYVCYIILHYMCYRQKAIFNRLVNGHSNTEQKSDTSLQRFSFPLVGRNNCLCVTSFIYKRLMFENTKFLQILM